MTIQILHERCPTLSVLELSTQTNLRLPKIKAGILSKKTRTQIGDDCGVSERTIRRDITDWTKTDDFLRWAREVWLHYMQKVDDAEVFRQATKIMVKTIPTQAEIKTEHKDIQVDVKRLEIVQLMDTYGEAVESAIQRNIQTLTRDRAKQQLDS